MEELGPRIVDEMHFSLLTGILSLGGASARGIELRKSLLSPEFSWQRLAETALNHDVLFPLIWSLDKARLLPPAPRMALLEGAQAPGAQLLEVYRNYLEFRQRQQAQLFSVVEALSKFGHVPLLLKGAGYLADASGGWAEARSMRDIDILVDKASSWQAWETLRGAGYQQVGEAEPNGKHLPELFHPDWPSAVEIHQEAMVFRGRRVLPASFLWSVAETRNTSSGKIRILPPVWQALHCSLNHQLTDHGHGRRVLALKPTWEITQLCLRFSPDDWKMMIEHARASGEERSNGTMLVLAQRLFGLTLPADLPLPAICNSDADETLARARWPERQRRSHFLIDQLRFGFSRETLALRYNLEPENVTIGTAMRHGGFLLRRYRGVLRQRLLGRQR